MRNFCVWGVLLGCLLAPGVWAQSSANYAVVGANLSAGGAMQFASANYAAITTFGQSTPLGISNSGNYQTLWGVQYVLLSTYPPSATMSAMPSATVTILKAGTGTGTVTVGAQTCGVTCASLLVPYTQGMQVQVSVTPAADSYFVRWERADGTPLAGLTYAQPGDLIKAIFNKK